MWSIKYFLVTGLIVLHNVTWKPGDHNWFAKVMFLHLSVILLTGGGVSRSRPRGVYAQVGVCPGGCPGPGSAGVQTQTQGVCVSQHALRQTAPLAADGYSCGRYVSYWNAFFYLAIICVRTK